MWPRDDRFAQEQVRQYPDGGVIFLEGEESHEMFVIQQGEVVVTKSSGKEELVLATLTKGAFFGEMALLESLPRSATARAKGSTRLLVLQPGGFLLKIRRDPTFAFELMHQLSRRIRRTNERLSGALASRKSTEAAVREIVREQEFGGEVEP